MELKINEITMPSEITFNFEELKQELLTSVDKYEGLIYTEEQMQDAKTDRAKLRKFKDALNQERIKRQKEYMKPFNEFKDKVDELIAIVDKPIALIDNQVKAHEEKEKEDKRMMISSIWNTIEHPEWLTLAKIFDDKWLNKTCSISQIKNDITSKLADIERDISTLEEFEYKDEAIQEYKISLDISKAIAEGKRISEIIKAKNQPKEEVTGNERMWLGFKAELSVAEALELKAFFNLRGIPFEPIKI